MRVLITGADGFIGRNVSSAFSEADDEVFHGTHNQLGSADPEHYRQLDLLDKGDIQDVISMVKPDVVVNCAGVVDLSRDVNQNRLFTQNLIEGTVSSGQKVGRVIICGSAAVYGQVEKQELPVDENTPLRGTSPYAISKKAEEDIAMLLGEKYSIPVTIARIFNPIGKNMGPKFLIPALLNQVRELKEGSRAFMETSRLDSKRDYVAVEDVAQAIKEIAHGRPQEPIYNVGSGTSTSNGRLIELILKWSGVEVSTPVKQTQHNPEPLMAVQADITKISDSFGWRPEKDLDIVIKEVVDDARYSTQ